MSNRHCELHRFLSEAKFERSGAIAAAIGYPRSHSFFRVHRTGEFVFEAGLA